MKFGKQALSGCLGAIVAHQVEDADGRKLLDKGQILSKSDIQALQGKLASLLVAILEEGDIEENEAATRVSACCFGENLKATLASAGRVKLVAEKRGILRLNVPLLEQMNSVDEGIAIATLPIHSLVQAGQTVAVVKIIPYALASSSIQDFEFLANENPPLISIRPLQARSVALLVTGRANQRQKLVAEYEAAVVQRLENLGSRLDSIVFCAHDGNEIAAILRQFQAVGFDLILLAGIAATIDRNDVVPSALLMAGGSIIQLGIPVDPGTLMLLGKLGKIPLIGASNALKSLEKNVIDLILPRLLAGEELSRGDLAALGHGGLLLNHSDSS
jgi:molybdenum cofactor cytidylyltransferase